MGGDDTKTSEPIEENRCLKSTMATAGCETLDHSPATCASTPLKVRDFRGMDPDGELVTRWQAGDQSAFEALIRRHESKVFGLLMRMLGNREEAEDVAQEAFLSLHRHGHRFRRESKFSTFVFRVTANAALNRRRTLGRKNARLAALRVRHDAGDDLPTSPRDPEATTSGKQVQAQVQEALLVLPEDLRMAIVLYDIEGLAYREIAAVLEIPEGTVKSRIHRARNVLRDRLKGLVVSREKGER